MLTDGVSARKRVKGNFFDASETDPGMATVERRSVLTCSSQGHIVSDFDILRFIADGAF